MKKIPEKARTCFFVLAGILIITYSCNNSRSSADEERKVITPVTITAISTGDISENIELPAVSAFLTKNIIRSTTTGMVEKVNISFGDNVRKNQPLFTLKTREASVIEGNMKPDSNMVLKGDIKINASKDGVITSVSHQAGDFVQEGDELAVISDRESFVFILEVPFELRNLAEKTKNCTIIFADNKTVTGTIGSQLPEMDPTAQTVKYFVKGPLSGTLPANLNVKIRIIKKESTRARLLPREAIMGNETQTEFWIMKLINDSVAVRIPIVKGIENSNNIEIKEPILISADRIILTGGYGLSDTANVIVKK